MVRILHVDDNETDRHLVKRELGRVFPDLHTHEVRDQQELDAALDSGDFDVTITDYQLGWSNGLLILNAVKARHPDCPVVMFTGTGNEEVAVEGMKAGLDDYVVKSPRHAIRLVTAVRSVLEKAEARLKVAVAERERADLLRREQAARAEAERLLREAREADRRKDEFLGMLAHELRNPLAPVRNAVHLLRQPGLPPEDLGRVVDLLDRQTKHLARIVDDLLDVSRITRGKFALRTEQLDLGRLVRVAVADQQAAFADAGLTAEVDVPEVPVWVQGDPTRLMQVVGNLLQNSVKFTPRGGTVSVRVYADASRGQAVLSVRDSGIGVEPDLLPHMFDAFAQGDRSLDRSKGGLGLGLALVKGIAELHGGNVEARSDGTGLGAEFTVYLPLAPEPAALIDVPTAARPALKPLRVLIVEDNRDTADSLRMCLERFGHDVAVAYSGPDGVRSAKEWRPDVVLCDIGLPGMSGYEVAKALRQHPATAKTRMVAVTGYGGDEDRLKSRQAGFDAHLTKPADPSKLQELLATF